MVICRGCFWCAGARVRPAAPGAQVLQARGLSGAAGARPPVAALNAFAVVTVATGAGPASAQTPAVRGAAAPSWDQARAAHGVHVVHRWWGWGNT